MRSEYVYIAWALVIAAFTWQINQEPDLSWMQQSRVYQTPDSRDRAFNEEIARENAQPVGIIGIDDRVEFASFRPDDFPWSSLRPNAYGASLILQCGRAYGSASLVHTADTIIFSAHQIIDDDGKIDRDLERCRAVAGTRDGRAYEIDWTSLKMGVNENRLRNSIPVDEDWAVVRLKEPMRGITPYILPTQEKARSFESSRLANVTAATDNWPDRRYFGMIGQTCNYIGIARDYRSSNVAAYDCDIGRGASGSGILAHNGVGDIYLFGIVNRMMRRTVRCDSAAQGACYAVGLRITDEISSAIRNMDGLVASSAASQQPAAPRI